MWRWRVLNAKCQRIRHAKRYAKRACCDHCFSRQDEVLVNTEIIVNKDSNECSNSLMHELKSCKFFISYHKSYMELGCHHDKVVLVNTAFVVTNDSNELITA